MHMCVPEPPVRAWRCATERRRPRCLPEKSCECVHAHVMQMHDSGMVAWAQPLRLRCITCIGLPLSHRCARGAAQRSGSACPAPSPLLRVYVLAFPATALKTLAGRAEKDRNKPADTAPPLCRCVVATQLPWRWCEKVLSVHGCIWHVHCKAKAAVQREQNAFPSILLALRSIYSAQVWPNNLTPSNGGHAAHPQTAAHKETTHSCCQHAAQREK